MNSKKLMMLIQVKGKLNPEIGIEIFHTGTETDDDGNTATKELKSSCTKEEGVKGTSDLPGFTFGKYLEISSHMCNFLRSDWEEFFCFW